MCHCYHQSSTYAKAWRQIVGMFQMVSGECCQCCNHTKQEHPCTTRVRHAACTVPGCGCVVKYQNTTNLEARYTASGLDHQELGQRLRQHQQLQRQTCLSVGADGSGGQTGKDITLAFTLAKKGHCDVKFVKWLVRKNCDHRVCKFC